MPRPLVLDAWLRRPLVVALSALALATLVGLTICAGLRQRYCPVGSARFQTRIILGRVQTAEERYAADHDGGCAPSLAALVDGHYLRRMPRDAWGHLLMYRCRAPASDALAPAAVTSAGGDGHFYTADDLRDDD